MEIDSNSLHPSIVSVSRIINVAFKDLKEEKKRYFYIFMFFIEPLLD